MLMDVWVGVSHGRKRGEAAAIVCTVLAQSANKRSVSLLKNGTAYTVEDHQN